MDEMRKLINLMESALSEAHGAKYPEQGTPEYEELMAVFKQLGQLRTYVADAYNQIPSLDPETKETFLKKVAKALQRPVQYLDRMPLEPGEGAGEFRIANTQWNALTVYREPEQRAGGMITLPGSTDRSPEAIQKMLKAMDTDLVMVMKKFGIQTTPFIK